MDQQAAAIFEHLQFDPQAMLADPMAAVKGLWLPYFRFWTSRPDETVFYHRFRDSMFFPKYDKIREVDYFTAFVEMVRAFRGAFPSLKRINQDLLWLHVLTSTVMYAKYVVEGILPNNQETEETVFQLLATGLSGYLRPDPLRHSIPGIPHIPRRPPLLCGRFLCRFKSKCSLTSGRSLIRQITSVLYSGTV